LGQDAGSALRGVALRVSGFAVRVEKQILSEDDNSIISI